MQWFGHDIILGFPPIMCLQIGAGICAVPTADTVATGEVIYYNCIVQLSVIPRLRQTTSQSYVVDAPL